MIIPSPTSQRRGLLVIVTPRDEQSQLCFSLRQHRAAGYAPHRTACTAHPGVRPRSPRPNRRSGPHFLATQQRLETGQRLITRQRRHKKTIQPQWDTDTGTHPSWMGGPLASAKKKQRRSTCVIRSQRGQPAMVADRLGGSILQTLPGNGRWQRRKTRRNYKPTPPPSGWSTVFLKGGATKAP